MAEPANVREWTDFVRRARLGRTVKGVALLLATFADSDGSRVFPGIARIAVTAEVDYTTAKRALGTLVKAGLLERVRSRTGKNGRSDEYRLCFAEEGLRWMKVLSPDELTAEIEAIRAKNRRSNRKGTGAQDTRPQDEETGDDYPFEEEGTGAGDPANEEGRVRAIGRDGYPLPAVPNHYRVTSTTLHENVADLRTDIAVVVPNEESKGIGFCLACYSLGHVVLAADAVNGAACEKHLRAA